MRLPGLSEGAQSGGTLLFPGFRKLVQWRMSRPLGQAVNEKLPSA